MLGSSEDTYNILIKTEANTSAIKDLESKLDNLDKTTQKNHTSFLKLSTAVAAGQAAFSLASTGISKMVGFLGDSVKSAQDSEEATTQMMAVLKSTGNAAGVTGGQLIKLADSLQKTTKFSDEAVMGAENLLLTFTNIKDEVFKDSIPLILDMSQALGQDLKSSSIQLGKALNDPIQGITALSRVGVSFTEKQKDTIKALVDTGKTAEAQRIILKELSTEFGGSAEAAGKTFGGRMEILKNQIDGVKESIGGAIIKGLTPLMSKIAEFVASDKFQEWLAKVGDWMSDNLPKAMNWIINTGFPALWAVITKVGDWMSDNLPKAMNWIINTGFPALWAVITTVVDVLKTLWGALKDVIDFISRNKPVIEGLTIAFAGLALAMNFSAITGAFITSMSAVSASLTAIRVSTLPSLAASLTGFGGFAVFAAAGIGAAVAIMNKFNELQATITATQNAIDSAGTTAQKSVQAMQKQLAAGKISAEQYAKSIAQITADSNAQVQANTYKPNAWNSFVDWTGKLFASGTDYAPGGTAIVGENGPELVNLPRGSQVIPSSQTARMGGGSTTTNTFTGNIYLGDAGAVNRFFEQLDRDSLLISNGLAASRGI